MGRGCNRRGKKTMTYDFILMNPPYDKNLHLKIVEQSIPMLTDDGILVNLSPIRWLQDPYALYLKDKSTDYFVFEKVRYSLVGLDSISPKDGRVMFDNTIRETLGLYVIRKDVANVWDNPYKSRLAERILSKGVKTLSDVKTPDNKGDFTRPFVCLSLFAGNVGKPSYYTITTKNSLSKPRTAGVHYSTINFSTKEEAVRFYNSLNCMFYKYVLYCCKTNINTPFAFVPFMGDCTNPRTGKKGYEGEWTDEDFREYFGITDSEWEEIVETMKPYL